jgi:acetyltransferase-like isoleucine patch superfamily enzyme
VPTRHRDAVPHPRVTVAASRGPHNSLWHFTRDVSIFRVVWNSLWIIAQRWMPSFRVKIWMLRLTGAHVGKHVSIGFESTLDILFPQDITIEDNVVIGYDTTILCHGYLVDAYQRGPVRIGRDAAIGARTLILPGVTIGDGAIIGAMSLVNRDVPAHEFWAGVPARKVRDLDVSAESVS